MKESHFLICNGTLYPSQQLLISADNRSFKYGDGFFETMKMINGNILFQNLHFERLFSSLQTLQFDKPDFFTTDYLLQQIRLLVKKNDHSSLSRIRLTIFRGDGNLSEANQKPNYIIQSFPLQSLPFYNEQGLSVDVYKAARKTADAFSHIKSNNYLPYAMATLWSKKNGFDDALLLNCHDRIAEATTSNIFMVKNGHIKTPAVTEGCVAGVTRQHLLSCLAKENMPCEEAQITITELMQADEIFLTNTGWHIQWIQKCGDKICTHQTSKFLYRQFIIPLLINNEK